MKAMKVKSYIEQNVGMLQKIQKNIRLKCVDTVEVES